MVLNRLAVRNPEAWSEDEPEATGHAERRNAHPPSGGVVPPAPPEGPAP